MVFLRSLRSLRTRNNTRIIRVYLRSSVDHEFSVALCDLCEKKEPRIALRFIQATQLEIGTKNCVHLRTIKHFCGETNYFLSGFAFQSMFCSPTGLNI
jgi:hypothetical protein